VPVLTLAEMLTFAEKDDWIKVDLEWLKSLAQEPDLVNYEIMVVHEHLERASYLSYTVQMPQRLKAMHEQRGELTEVDEDKPRAEDSEFVKLLKVAHYANAESSLRRFTQKNSRKKLARLVVISEQ
jgi:hypothetical protein